MSDLSTRAQEWNALISTAVETPDAVLANFRITRLHYLLSTVLREVVGAEAGANFHSWAVWGSRKAGVTIRQDDKDQASRDATVVAGIVGGLVGVGVGWAFAAYAGWLWWVSFVFWLVVGILVGGYCGFLLAGYTRKAASRLILEGNCIVLDDIGRETARYLEYAHQHSSRDAGRAAAWQEFLATFRDGPTERGGQDLLRRTFEQYETARLTNDYQVAHECNYFANCLAVLHENIRLQPYISRSLPYLIRKCVTQRLMTYSVGEQLLAVHEDVPSLDGAVFPETLMTINSSELRAFLDGPEGWDTGRGTLKITRTNDWTKIRERMGYIVNLFRTRHLDPNVVASPYVTEQLAAITVGELPARPW
ncbi:hypothetical protein CA54_01380 [Symmachiella macrocystis]|uniref:Uncharacterized protein n=1 Tax=Symmachiella macrocystis TaxID=2527985 RepID=A0A5C6BHY8_9PLAN|nr:hypothetical protein [Symmachiella macrocystis]TWU11332.1 hypothetical protein CA54_01380 [Symmachiella macrocystis]